MPHKQSQTKTYVIPLMHLLMQLFVEVFFFLMHHYIQKPAVNKKTLIYFVKDAELPTSMVDYSS